MPSHGSLSKAGKVRDQNKILWRDRRKNKKGNPTYHKKKHKCPKVNRRRKYNIWYNETYVKPVLIGAGIIREERRRRKK